MRNLDNGLFEPHRNIEHIEMHIENYVTYVPMWFKGAL